MKRSSEATVANRVKRLPTRRLDTTTVRLQTKRYHKTTLSVTYHEASQRSDARGSSETLADIAAKYDGSSGGARDLLLCYIVE
jgi:hypothetical protein